MNEDGSEMSFGWYFGWYSLINPCIFVENQVIVFKYRKNIPSNFCAIHNAPATDMPHFFKFNLHDEHFLHAVLSSGQQTKQ